MYNPQHMEKNSGTILIVGKKHQTPILLALSKRLCINRRGKKKKGGEKLVGNYANSLGPALRHLCTFQGLEDEHLEKFRTELAPSREVLLLCWKSINTDYKITYLYPTVRLFHRIKLRCWLQGILHPGSAILTFHLVSMNCWVVVLSNFTSLCISFTTVVLDIGYFLALQNASRYAKHNNCTQKLGNTFLLLLKSEMLMVLTFKWVTRQ